MFEEQEEEAKDWRVDARLQAACKADAGKAWGRGQRLGGAGALRGWCEREVKRGCCVWHH